MMLAMVVWVATETVGSLVSPGTSIPQIVWLRYACHLGLMLIVFGPRHGLGLVRTSRPVLQLVRSLLMLGMPLSFMIASRRMSPGLVMAGFFVAPLLVLLGARVAGSRVASVTWALAAAGWVGALGVFGAPPRGLLGLLATGGMAATFALYVLLTAELDRTEPLLTNLFHSALAVFAALTLAIPWWWAPYSLRTVAVGAVVAILGWLALAAIDLSLRGDPPEDLALFILAYAIAHEVMGLALGHRSSLRALAGAVVVAGVLAAGLAVHRRMGARAHSAASP